MTSLKPTHVILNVSPKVTLKIKTRFNGKGYAVLPRTIVKFFNFKKNQELDVTLKKLTKCWCSNCGHEFEGELRDGSYYDEEFTDEYGKPIYHYLPDADVICPKCGFSTGIKAIKEHFKKKGATKQ